MDCHDRVISCRWNMVKCQIKLQTEKQIKKGQHCVETDHKTSEKWRQFSRKPSAQLSYQLNPSSFSLCCHGKQISV